MKIKIFTGLSKDISSIVGIGISIEKKSTLIALIFFYIEIFYKKKINKTKAIGNG